MPVIDLSSPQVVLLKFHSSQRQFGIGRQFQRTRDQPSGCSWEDLLERPDFHALEDAVGDVGVACDELPDFFQRLGLDDDQAAGTVRERSGERQSAFLFQALQVGEVSGSVLRTFLFGVTGIVGDDHKQHFSSCALGLQVFGQ
jgi:hypothetical protein